jgi:hypothetical protein
MTTLTVRGAQELKGVPYEWPGRGTRYIGSQRLHASATETKAHVAKNQAQGKNEKTHLQQEIGDKVAGRILQIYCAMALSEERVKPEHSLIHLLSKR